MNLFIKGYAKAKGIDPNAKKIVNLLNCNKTISATKQRIPEYKNPKKIEILPEAIGLSFVLSTFLSKFLSAISLMIQPADLIKTAPKKNNNKKKIKDIFSSVKSYAIVKPQAHGQNKSIKPIGFFNLVNSIKR